MKNLWTKIQLAFYANPTMWIFAAGCLLVALWIYLPQATDSFSKRRYERKIERLDREIEQLDREIDQKKDDGIRSEAKAEAYREAAEIESAETGAIKRQIERKKQNVRKIENKTADDASRVIADDAVPSADELCSRANRLGVRCDLDKIRRR